MTPSQEKNYRQYIIDLGLKYKYDENHAFFVEKASVLIFDFLAGLHKLGNAERILLAHAAQLHDIGNYLNSIKHSRHSKYIIDNDALMSEYPERERVLLSLIVYNHRKKIHKDTSLLPKKEKDIVLKLSAILRIADSMDYTREEVVIKNMVIENTELKINIEGVLPERLAERVLRKKKLFNDIFGLDVILR